MIPKTHIGEHVLGSAATKDTWLTYESRTAGFTGPQGACHPNDLELSVTLNGAGCSRVGGKDLLNPERHYSIVGPGVEHSSWTADTPVVELNVHVSSALLHQAAETLSVANQLRQNAWPRDVFATRPELAGVVTAFIHEAKQPNPSPLAIEGLGLYLASFLLDRHHRAPTPTAHLAQGRERCLQKSVELMRAAMAEPLNLDALAQSANLGRFRYVHAFKARFGLPPYAYLTRLRTEAAVSLIESTDLPLTRIALDVGFGASSRLSEAFKCRYGQTPSAWRAAQRKKRK